ncbi:histone-lysine N-methyltransferase, putative [Plasmodium berghei]|uniref:Histone-lysine N-methyltransferase, putative n=1 Tax=Plasmodium berghei TaxID=5821 RepID=A0A1C6YSX2_PLABE|nr:histone-lysine N-methyltransferase, putative [Plasmodium berghei]SCN28478.1 histone-lysine N-methyltransferase, putative [Plasmodium berghei]SCO62668.1 histone-lysine N-methyltransferase, putative [Plasmodium berghei]SCO64229.1 histone-lysine N-methyltransferase, putative [Plasmodium berghei]
MHIIRRKIHNYFAKNKLAHILKKDEINFNDIHKNIFIGKSNYNGLGVFSFAEIKKNEIIEVCPTIKIENENIPNNLIDYLFENSSENANNEIVQIMNPSQKNINYKLFPLGYGILYNHSDTPNAFFQIVKSPMSNENETVASKYIMILRSLKKIKKDEEICISYGNAWWKDRKWKPLNEENIMRQVFHPSNEK